TREFYREWANQDASEAVFEKSRDPRWRIDLWSIDPPAMSRFADPYDPEFPPAPPDDLATEALSPVPQAPDNRLIVPAAGTGWVEMRERWREEREAAVHPGQVLPRNGIDQGVGTPAPRGSAAPLPPGTPSPFAQPSGTGAYSTPVPIPAT